MDKKNQDIHGDIRVLTQRFDDFERNSQENWKREFERVRSDIQGVANNFVNLEKYAAFETKANLKFRAIFWAIGALFLIVAGVVGFTFTALGQKLIDLAFV